MYLFGLYDIVGVTNTIDPVLANPGVVRAIQSDLFYEAWMHKIVSDEDKGTKKEMV
jgi:hypothetical protein